MATTIHHRDDIKPSYAGKANKPLTATTLAMAVLWALLLWPLASHAQGVPFLRNYMGTDYHAHNINYDVEIDDDGVVYVANLEGLLYYDHADWHVIHTPGISRITVVKLISDGSIWVGGYNFFGRIERKDNGERYLRRIGSATLFRGEVQEIWEADNEVHFLVNDDKSYKVADGQVSVDKQISNNALQIGLNDVINPKSLEDENKLVILQDTLQKQPIGNGLVAVVMRGQGLLIQDSKGRDLFTITEANGLCSNNVVWTAYKNGQLWGATENGLFELALPSPFSRFTTREGLAGEVLSINKFHGTIYVGTTKGLFRQEGRTFVNVAGVQHACWTLSESPSGLLAATADGVYRVTVDGVAHHLTTIGTMSVMALPSGDGYYAGGLNGVIFGRFDGRPPQKVCELEKVTRIVTDSEGTVWLQNVYGEIWFKKGSDKAFKPYKGRRADEAATLVPLEGKYLVVGATDLEPIPYPQYSYEDHEGVSWLTNSEGKELYRIKDGNRLTDLDPLLTPFHGSIVRALYYSDNQVWIGNDHGLVVIDTRAKDPTTAVKPQVKFRQVMVNDSVLWGGQGTPPERLPHVIERHRELHFSYALNFVPPVGVTLYRYRMNNEQWSAWSPDTHVNFPNLLYGSYTIEVQAMLPSGDITDTASLKFSIASPLYLRWYIIICFILLFILLGYAIMRYRLHRLRVEKARLENIVQERTAEVVRQKDEIEAQRDEIVAQKDEIENKSRSLESALQELSDTQHELIRQAKMATVGKLTQGLIDRILNPLNYINNFSKLSSGLLRDLKANIEDSKDGIDQEDYEDTMDIIGMLNDNLEKVSQHGQNTSRTLKAMEEMLKDRSGGMAPMDLVAVLKQNEDMLLKYYAADIAKYNIKVTFALPPSPVTIKGNADLLSKTIMSLLGNSVYAIVKKAKREAVQPELRLALIVGESATVTIRDTGIGIEKAIIDKVFDPFFTTKTTSEASGVGLYLSREVVQNHGGDITLRSEKDEYAEFTIVLPLIDAQKEGTPPTTNEQP